MKKFKCKVTREDEYEIEIDENIIDEEWMEQFREYMYDFTTHEEHAEQIAQLRARFGGDFMEGYGYPLVDGAKPWHCEENDKRIEKGINIKIISEDDDCYVDVEEIK